MQKYHSLGTFFSVAGSFTGDLTQSLASGDYQQLVGDHASSNVPSVQEIQNVAGLIHNANRSYGSSYGSPSSVDSQVVLQEVQNLGYDFYLGQIEESGVNDINDDLKNQITQVVYQTHFPESLLKKTPIIILNNLALTGNQFIRVDGTFLRVPIFKADFLSEGGLYSLFPAANEAVIFINKSTLTSGLLNDVLAHELGHAVGNTLTDSQWMTFYQLRNIPPNTPRDDTNWNLSPQEDFAEVYRNVFTGGDVRTFYGLLTPTMGYDMACDKVYQPALDVYMPKNDPNNPSTWFMPSGSDYALADAKATADPKVQACRRQVLSNPSKWQFGMPPYKATVGPKTKQFIETVVASSSLL